MRNDIMGMLNELVQNFGTRMSKEKLVDKMYSLIASKGIDVAVLNEKYLDVCGRQFQFIKRKTGWEVKEF